MKPTLTDLLIFVVVVMCATVLLARGLTDEPAALSSNSSEASK